MRRARFIILTCLVSVAPRAFAKSPAHRFVESGCAAVLALTANDVKLYGQAAHDWVRTLPPGPFSFAKAQRDKRVYVQTSVLTGPAVANRLHALQVETKRLNREVTSSRRVRHGLKWSQSTYLTLAAVSGVGLAAGLVAGPQSWPGAVGAVSGLGSLLAWVDKAVAKHRYLPAPRGQPSAEFIDLFNMRDMLENDTTYDYAATVSAVLNTDLIATCRTEGRTPADCLVDAVDDNVTWNAELHPLRPAMEVIVHFVLSGSAAAGPALTTIVYFLVAQPQSDAP